MQLGKYTEARTTIRKSKMWLVKGCGEKSPEYLGVKRELIAVLEKQGKFDAEDGSKGDWQSWRE